MRGHLCGKPAKAYEGGVWLCSLHTAEGIAKRNAALNAKHESRMQALREQSKRSELREKRAAIFGELVDALRSMVLDMDHKCETSPSKRRAEELLEKAEAIA